MFPCGGSRNIWDSVFSIRTENLGRPFDTYSCIYVLYLMWKNIFQIDPVVNNVWNHLTEKSGSDTRQIWANRICLLYMNDLPSHHVWTLWKRNDSSGPGAQQYCSNEDGHASPVMKRRSLVLQGHYCQFLRIPFTCASYRLFLSTYLFHISLL